MALATIIIVYVGTNILLGIDILNKKTSYFAFYDNVNGLKISNPVIVSGYKVGHVKNIQFVNENTGKLKVEIFINTKIDIPKNSIIAIVSKDLLGGMCIEIQPGDSKESAKDGDTLNSYLQTSLFDGLDQAKEKLFSIINSIDSITSSLNGVFSESGSKDLKSTLNNLAETSHGLNSLINGNKGNINNTLSTLNNFATSLNSKKTKIGTAIDNFSNISDSISNIQFNRLVNELQSTMDHLNRTVKSIDQADGTVGKLIKQDSLYVDVQNTIENLNALVADIKANPKRYINLTVFGGKEKKKKN